MLDLVEIPLTIENFKGGAVDVNVTLLEDGEDGEPVVVESWIMSGLSASESNGNGNVVLKQTNFKVPCNTQHGRVSKTKHLFC